MIQAAYSTTSTPAGTECSNTGLPFTSRQPARISPYGVRYVAEKEPTPSMKCGLNATFLNPASFFGAI